MNQIDKIQYKINNYITLKRYIYVLFAFSLFFIYVEQSYISLVYMLFAFIGLIYQDKMKKQIWEDK